MEEDDVPRASGDGLGGFSAASRSRRLCATLSSAFRKWLSDASSGSSEYFGEPRVAHSLRQLLANAAIAASRVGS